MSIYCSSRAEFLLELQEKLDNEFERFDLSGNECESVSHVL